MFLSRFVFMRFEPRSFRINAKSLEMVIVEHQAKHTASAWIAGVASDKLGFRISCQVALSGQVISLTVIVVSY